MSALTSDRSIPARDGRLLPQPVAAGAVIHAGGLVALNTTGYAHGGANHSPETLFDGITFDPANPEAYATGFAVKNLKG